MSSGSHAQPASRCRFLLGSCTRVSQELHRTGVTWRLWCVVYRRRAGGDMALPYQYSQLAIRTRMGMAEKLAVVTRQEPRAGEKLSDDVSGKRP
jgi:hypothetical protein